MAALLEGQDYGLISNEACSSHKTVIHVKLTDSALRALEEFSKIKSKTTKQPSIQFQGNNGFVTVPIEMSSDNSPAFRTFQFAFSNIPSDRNGSFECMEQLDGKYGHTLQSLGVMDTRINVQASDDVYRNTREKMTLAEEESKKVCTKEIKPSGRYISKKVKKVLSGSQHHHLLSSKPGNAASKPIPHKGVSPQSGLAARLCNPHPTISGSAAPPIVSHHSPHRTSGGGYSPNKGSNQNASSAPLSGRLSGGAPLNSAGTKNNSALYNMSYRDRIIHLLALRPYKKPELLLRLQRDGIKEKDKGSLGTVLHQLATLGRDNAYVLAKHAYNDVRQDWPFYSPTDRALLKRNLQSDVRSSSNSPAVSPASCSPHSPDSSSQSNTTVNLQKRQIIGNSESYHPMKKQRISHHDKKKEVAPHHISNSYGDKSDKHDKHKPKAPSLSPDSNSENQELNANPNAVSSSNYPDYLRSYTNIKTSDQRQKYKHDFNTDYDEYCKLHMNIASVSKKFCEFESQMKQTKKGTRDFEVLKNRIMQEYLAQKSDEKFIEQKKRFNYLHLKLAHIKKLISDFDQHHVAQQTASL
ncbi:RNA polymerase II elongation factor ELL-like [Gigantopelta aegis]|uniref:RNA polymerase II elongation factor ELL-like n=1 Tax=Gigantopelta aegis TaxID=1735272 RepID=UPI001B88A5E5|nr:RNA polymerase II elongation factor ELL-like [Gigantopelta aegis]